ncbi:hypothetical protein D6C99_04105 [Aureobasidium pullulans]|uniref:C3H1-type domain-containing protein n=1 Tax=Aureobasidium pullulans TaxID=5580 RepID=A0A4S9EDH4_AURPU|nr:hypothetical protein D6D12_02369 [Aureobasidium pullulans]THX62658.1 hypothetical protein D6D11_02362 [Aureobasidium pullulans]THY52547.1 hypothetical protein D6C99_04105 [Aureobasidium pullulans]
MATPKSRRPFEEAADSDSDVNSDTTVQSDSEAEYSVEKVCPLFDEAVAREEEQREKRVAKRAEKRRKKLARRLVPRKALKKGVARKADRGASSSSDTESPPRKRNTVLLDPPTPGRSTVQKRATVDDTVSKPNVTLPASSAKKKPQSNVTSTQAGPYKAKDHIKATGGSAKPQSKPSTAPNLSKLPDTATPRRVSDANLALRPGESANNSRNKDTPSTTTTTTTTVARPATLDGQPSLKPSTAANTTPKVAPRLAGPSRPKPIKLFMDKSTKRQRPRVNEYTPKDSTDTQFANLALQRRMQLYSHNEPAPDPNALRFIDPSTGKIIDNANNSSTNALRLDTNVERVSDVALSEKSAPGLEARSASISDIQRTPLNGRVSMPQSAQEVAPKFAYPSAQPAPPRFNTKGITCRFWLRGTCKKSESECIYAHEWTGVLDKKKNAPCTFFLNGGCMFTDQQCEYQHNTSSKHGEREDVNDLGALQRPDRSRRRSESPDHSGKRQDEVEGRRGRSSLSQIKTRLDERSPMISPSLASTATFETRNEPDTHVAHPRMRLDVDYEWSANAVGLPDVAISDPGNQPDLSEPVNACLTISPASPPVFTMDVKLSFDTKSCRSNFLSTYGENVSLEGTDICRSRDFEAYWFEADKTLASGQIVSAVGDTMVAYLEDFLILHSSGVVVRGEKFVLVVYPTQNPDWKFMPHRGPERSGLRWHLQGAGPEMLEPLVTKPTKSSFPSMCTEHLGLDSEVLFAANKGKQTDKLVCLFFPREAPETKVVEAFLVDSRAKICFSDDHERWAQFCNNKGSSGVILFHPSMNAFWKVPEFYSVLATTANVFQIGVSKSSKSRPDLPMQYSCTRLFPNGSLTLITDDIFKYYPALAVRVLESFESLKLKAQGARCDRIYCRPGILAWLAELIDEDCEQGISTEDSPRVRCWQLACDLLNVTVADNSSNPFRSDMGPPPLLYSPRKSQMPEYGPLWDSSEQEATDFLVGWFAGHCVDECESYRRFTVVYEQHGATAPQTPGLLQSANPKDPKGWMLKYRHLKVTTPNRLLAAREEYEKSKMRQR